MNIHPSVLERGLKNGKYKYTDLGLERRCTKCTEFWPADAEFWHAATSQNDGMASWCRACSNEYRAAKRRAA